MSTTFLRQISASAILLASSVLLFFAFPVHAQSTPATPATSTFPVSPVSLSANGIFTCNPTGAMSVGSLSAIGGVFVPVSDAAVTLNTGFLVQKECLLDGLAAKQREQATFMHAELGIAAFNEGREGGPMLPEDLWADYKQRLEETILYTLENDELSPLDDAFEAQVTRAVVQNYRDQAETPNQMLACPYQGDLDTVLDGTTEDVWGGLMAAVNPACNPLGAFLMARNYVQGNGAQALEEMKFRLETGQGVYGVEERNPETGRYETRTPGIFVKEITEQNITTGLRQLENVDEINQMVNSLYSGLPSHILSDRKGLTGVTQRNAGQPSYLDQLARGVTQGVRDSAINIALRSLNIMRQAEQTYFNAMNAIATHLTRTIGQLREAENQCWALVAPKVKTYASQNNIQITVATSTAKSQLVIDSQIAPLASTTVTNIQTSETALTLINRLIADVTSANLATQRAALLQLDALVARGLVHNQFDAQQATKRAEDVDGVMKDLVEDTVVAWADSTDPNIGWCNTNNPAAIQKWAEDWRN